MSHSAPEIIIAEGEIPSHFGSYQHRVIERGHIPGVLSGAELTGKARNYALKYARSRSALRAWLAQYGVRDRLVLVEAREGRRWCRVWTDAAGSTPVRVRIVPDAEREAAA